MEDITGWKEHDCLASKAPVTGCPPQSLYFNEEESYLIGRYEDYGCVFHNWEKGNYKMPGNECFWCKKTRDQMISEGK
jgi:hypothetical protein